MLGAFPTARGFRLDIDFGRRGRRKGAFFRFCRQILLSGVKSNHAMACLQARQRRDKLSCMQRLKAMVTAIGMLHLLVVFGSSRLQHEPAVPYAVRYALWLAQWVLLAPIGYVPAFIKPIGESPAASFFLIALNSML